MRLVLAALAAGGWVFLSGILMAAAFGYRDLKAAFDALGLAPPEGAPAFVTHTVVRFAMGAVVAILYAVLLRSLSPAQAVLAAAGFAWILGVVLPFTVMVQWGLFSWPLAARIWAWGAAEFLVAAGIARLLYRA